MTEDERKKKRIARDGETVRVSMTMMDSVQQAVATSVAYAIDPVGHRPGSLPLTDSQIQQREALYLTRDAVLSDAWRKP